MTEENAHQSGTAFERFRKFAKKVVSVPKAEIDRREKEYQRKRQRVRKQRKS